MCVLWVAGCIFNCSRCYFVFVFFPPPFPQENDGYYINGHNHCAFSQARTESRWHNRFLSGVIIDLHMFAL